MNEKKDDVKTIGELRKAVMNAVGSLDGCMELYEAVRESTDHEQRFNEGRYGRTALDEIDKAHAALTKLRMRVQLQLDGRDNARARQLDRILGIQEGVETPSEVERSTFQERVTDLRAEVDDGGGTT